MTGIHPLGGSWEAGTPKALTRTLLDMDEGQRQLRDTRDRGNNESRREKLRGKGKEIPRWIRDRYAGDYLSDEKPAPPTTL